MLIFEERSGDCHANLVGLVCAVDVTLYPISGVLRGVCIYLLPGSLPCESHTRIVCTGMLVSPHAMNRVCFGCRVGRVFCDWE